MLQIILGITRYNSVLLVFKTGKKWVVLSYTKLSELYRVIPKMILEHKYGPISPRIFVCRVYEEKVPFYLWLICILSQKQLFAKTETLFIRIISTGILFTFCKKKGGTFTNEIGTSNKKSSI